MNVPALDAEQALAAWRSLRRAAAKTGRALRRELEPLGVRPGQARIVRLIGEAGPSGMKLNDLSERMCVTSANITRLMDRVEQGGYVVRQADPDDRRVVRAILTPNGRELLEKLVPVHRAWVERCMSCLSAEEQVQLAGLLSRVAAHAAAMLEGDEEDE